MEILSVMTGVAKHLVVGVDDDFRLRESLKSLVESSGYAAATYSSAKEFLQSGALAGAACLVADVRMPGMTGIELQRRIRLDRPELPVIFISAHQDDEARERALDDLSALRLVDVDHDQHSAFDPVVGRPIGADTQDMPAPFAILQLHFQGGQCFENAPHSGLQVVHA
jgi:CheY-like chemotaxis protein